MKHATCLIICVLLTSITPLATEAKVSAYQLQEIDETFSFENDLEGLTIRSNQSEPGLPPPVTQSQERATDGLTSLKFTINRLSVFQRVWIEKAFSLKPNQVYDITIDYSFASRDCCHSNPSGIITGVLNKSPDPATRDLVPAGQGEADNGATTLSDYKWLSKQYTFIARTEEQGNLYAVVGVGGGEATRSYFFDKVHIKITERSVPCEFYSFESDLEGWTARAIDFDSQSNPPSWSVTPSDVVFQDGQTSLEFTINSPNNKPKVWVEKAFAVESKQKYRVKVEYSLFSQEDVSDSRFLTGALNASPQSAEDLGPFYQESVGAYDRVWRRYQHEFTVKAKRGLIYVVIGVFARQREFQAFNFDNVCITVIPK